MLSGRRGLVVLLIFVLLVSTSYFINSQTMSLETVTETDTDVTLSNVTRARELGVFFVGSSDAELPSNASWVVASNPEYSRKNENISVILNWYFLHRPWEPFNPFKNESDIKEVENKLLDVSEERFWGILFVCEETYRLHVDFNDDLNVTWFGERLLGYPIYVEKSPYATKDQWMDEMFLRMIRGFHSHFSGKIKVGITAPADSIVENYRNQSWSKGWRYYFGEPAMAYISGNYDFAILYTYTQNIGDFAWTKQYLHATDQLFEKQKKFWILTRPWKGFTEETWRQESMALEIKNCLDRNIVISCYYNNSPPLEETWKLIEKGAKLWSESAPYYESYVYGQNLLTGLVGKTYGWIAT